MLSKSANLFVHLKEKIPILGFQKKASSLHYSPPAPFPLPVLYDQSIWLLHFSQERLNLPRMYLELKVELFYCLVPVKTKSGYTKCVFRYNDVKQVWTKLSSLKSLYIHIVKYRTLWDSESECFPHCYNTKNTIEQQ